MNDTIDNVLKQIWRSVNYTNAMVEHYTNHVALQKGVPQSDVKKEIDQLAQKFADQNKIDYEQLLKDFPRKA